MSKKLNGKARRSVDGGQLPPLGSDDYHRDLTMARRARRRSITQLEGGGEDPDDEETDPEIFIPKAPPTPHIIYRPVNTMRAAGRAMQASRPLQVGAITALIAAVSSAVVAIIEALK